MTIKNDAVAIIGMACRFPDANTPEAFWKNLLAGHCSVQTFNRETLLAEGVPDALLESPAYVAKGAPLADVDLFDAGYFGLTPREACVLDPQHRFMFEMAVETLERAGYGKLDQHDNTGLFGAISPSTYFLQHLLPQAQAQTSDAPGVDEAYWGTRSSLGLSRIAYQLNLGGPVLQIDTACSSSLVAVHQALCALRLGECDMALAGGISIHLPNRAGYLYQQDSIMAPDGLCRAYDANAAGTARGNGGAMVLLKRYAEALDDGDTVLAVIAGSAVNNDGNRRVGFTAPSIDGQVKAMRQALDDAGLATHIDSPPGVGVIEGHGSGTRLGDAIEIAALTRVYSTVYSKPHSSAGIALGSVKSNIGHLDAAAGIASLVKGVLMLNHRQIVQSLHFSEPNPELTKTAPAFYVPQSTSDWPSTSSEPRRLAVNSLGIGGTNCHMILAEPLPADETEDVAHPLRYPLLLSAKTQAALQQYCHRLGQFLSQNYLNQNYLNQNYPNPNNASLLDLAYTLCEGRQHFEKRLVLVVTSNEDACWQLQQAALASSFPTDLAYSEALAHWCQGGAIDWSRLQMPWKGKRIALPTYCFDRQRYWVSLPTSTSPTSNSPIVTAGSTSLDKVSRPPLSTPYRAATTSLETQLLEIWEHAFGIDGIGVDDNFFELGGHSLLATQIISQINQRLHCAVNLNQFFQSPTIASLSLAVTPLATDVSSLSPAMVDKFMSSKSLFSLSPMQKELWYQHQCYGEKDPHILILAYRIEGALQVEYLERAIRLLVQRHALLRTRFTLNNGLLCQYADPKGGKCFLYENIERESRSVTAKDLQFLLEQVVFRFTQLPFDISQGPLFQAKLTRLHGQDHLLMIRQHRLITDAQSLGTLFKSLIAYYRQLAHGSEPAIEKEQDYFRYAEQLNQALAPKIYGMTPYSRRLEQQLNYWRQVLHEPQVTCLPGVQYPHSQVSDVSTGGLRFVIESEASADILAKCRQLQVSPFAWMMASYKIALHCFTHQQDMLVITPTLNRDQPDYQYSMGLFMNRVAIRSWLRAEQTIVELVRQEHHAITQALAHQEIPFETLLERLGLMTRYRAEPLFKTLFMFQDTEQDEHLEFGDMVLSPLPVPVPEGRYHLTTGLRYEKGCFHGRIEYATALLSAEQIEPFIEAWMRIMKLMREQATMRMDELAALISSMSAVLLSPAASDLSSSCQDFSSTATSRAVQLQLLNAWQSALAKPLPEWEGLWRQQDHLCSSNDYNADSKLHANWWQCGGDIDGLVLMFDSLRETYPTLCLRRWCRNADLINHSELLQQAMPVTNKPLPAKSMVLGSLQQRLLFLQTFYPACNAWHLPAAYLLSGDVDVPRFMQAIEAAVRQWPLLQSVIYERHDEYAWIQGTDNVKDAIQFMNLSSLEEMERDDLIDEVMSRVINTPFAFKEQPLWRLALLQLADRQLLVILCFHHIVADGSSGQLLVKQVLQNYLAKTQHDPVPALTEQGDYFEFVAEQEVWLRSQQAHYSIRFWQAYLQNVDVINLPYDYSPQHGFGQGRVHEFRLARDIVAPLERFAQQQGVTRFTLWMAIYGLVLTRLSQTKVFCIGIPTNLRQSPRFEATFGPLINTLPIRMQANHPILFSSFVADLQAEISSVLQHHQLPFEQIVQLVSLTRDTRKAPLVQTFFALHETWSKSVTFDTLELQTIAVPTMDTAHEVSLELRYDEGALHAAFCFNADLFGATTQALFVDLFCEIAQSLSQRVDQVITELNLMTSVNTPVQPPTAIWEPLPFLHYIGHHAQITPDHVAIEYADIQLTYAQLLMQVEGMTSWLRGQGVRPNDGVLIDVSRSEKLPIVLLSILKLGAFFIPLDRRWPEQRRQRVMTTANAKWLFQQTQREITLTLLEDTLPAETHDTPLAYVLFTSGSTGIPKGVAISCASLSNYVSDLPAAIAPRNSDRVLALSTLSFDPSLLELLVSLCKGATVVVLADEATYYPAQVVKTMSEKKITWLQATPSVWALLDEQAWPPMITPLRGLIGGERLPKALAHRLLARGIDLYNVYGPTETTIWCTYQPVTQQHLNNDFLSTPAIGHMFPSYGYAILDEWQQPVAKGMIGELYISGPGLAQGYWRDPARSQQAFVTLGLQGRLEHYYRTGDLVKNLQDGTLYYLGRCDHQVKWHGTRLEPGEIESALLAIEGVSKSAVVFCDTLSSPQLWAFVVAPTLNIDSVRQALSRQLPETMLPNRIKSVNLLPYTTSGKVDRQTLIQWIEDEVAHVSIHVEQNDDTQRKALDPLTISIMLLWRELLNNAKIGPDDSFFSVGGTSLLAIRVINRLSNEMQATIPLALLFDFPTPRKLAASLSAVYHDETRLDTNINDNPDEEEESWVMGVI